MHDCDNTGERERNNCASYAIQGGGPPSGNNGEFVLTLDDCEGDEDLIGIVAVRVVEVEVEDFIAGVPPKLGSFVEGWEVADDADGFEADGDDSLDEVEDVAGLAVLG